MFTANSQSQCFRLKLRCLVLSNTGNLNILPMVDHKISQFMSIDSRQINLPTLTLSLSN